MSKSNASTPITEQQTIIAKRRKARHYAMQALYQSHMSGSPSVKYILPLYNYTILYFLYINSFYL